MPNCELCGRPMPPGEEMLKFHGYSGPCTAPPLDMGERYVVTFNNKKAGGRTVFARSNDLGEARRWVHQIDQATFPQLTDRQAD